MSNQKEEAKPEIPSLDNDPHITSEVITPVTVADAVGCQHDFVLKGYEVICTKCPLGLYVSSYADFMNLTKKSSVVK